MKIQATSVRNNFVANSKNKKINKNTQPFTSIKMKAPESLFPGMRSLSEYMVSISKKPIDASEVIFDKSIARLKDNSLNTGHIQKKCQNGDVVRMYFKDGVLIKSIRKGVENFVKQFSYDEKNRLSKITINSRGKVEEIKYAFHDTGYLKSKISTSGKVEHWSADGQLKTQEFPDGTIRQWYPNGKIMSEKLPNMPVKKWDKEGNLIIR